MKRTVLILLALLCGVTFVWADNNNPPEPVAVPTDDNFLPKIAVCVTGDLADNRKKILSAGILVQLVNSGRYSSLERHAAFADALGKEEIAKSDGTVNDSLILALGKQHGAGYVCIVSTVPFSEDEYQIFAMIINVETAQVAAMGDTYSQLKRRAM
jgi:hypothetical protein